MFARSERYKMINRINKKKIGIEFDLIVIGGGINGSGIARDAAERGLKVLLIEKEDYSSGATSASTRLIHGGLRYLEHFEFSLVRESLSEREFLLKQASHLVRPLKFCFPVYKTDKRKLWYLNIGMLFYEMLSLGKSLPGYKIISPKKVLREEPSISDKDISGLIVYYDAQVQFPERLCLENILMATNKGAITLNHAKVESFQISENEIQSLTFIDKLTNNSYIVKAKQYVNASGPWVDTLCKNLKSNIKRKIGGTKGSHIIVRKFSSGPSNALLATAQSDGRPIFIIPWNNNYLIGTTDIHFDGDLDNVKVSYEEVNYLVSEANHVLKNYQITKDDILFTYSGVRPLPYVGNKAPASITRKHIISDHASDGINNMVSIIGGKLTTYRRLSEEVVDLIIRKLNIKHVSSKTLYEPLMGTPNENYDDYKLKIVKKHLNKSDLDADILEHLLSIYGKKYKKILDLVSQNPDMGKLISSSSLDIQAQIYYALEFEQAYTITDLFRRISLGLSSGLGEDAVPLVSDMLAKYYELSQEEINKQVEDYFKSKELRIKN